MQQPTRYQEIDLLRGTAILLMVVYHAAYDLSVYYHWHIAVQAGGWKILERCTAGLFLLLVGVSAAISFARMWKQEIPLSTRLLRHGKRAMMIGMGAAIVSATTFAIDPETYVRFGILHLIAVSALLLPLLAFLREGNLLLGIVCFIAAKPLFALLPAPNVLLPLGKIPANFSSVDYFPLFPWFGVILIGYAIGYLLYVRWATWRTCIAAHLSTTNSKLSTASAPLALAGRHSLLLYLIHQPIILGMLWMMLGPP